MFKAIWKGIRWFFSVNEKTHNKISRKHGFAHVKPNDQPIPVKVYGLDEQEKDNEIVEAYKQLVELFQEVKLTEAEKGSIEAAKKDIWFPRGITEKHLEHILISCGFQKYPGFGGKQEFDPRLLQALKYAINMYSAKVSVDLERILLDSKESN